ncbi:MAG: NADH-quinone oxidoreductase subunit L [Anaerolineales bacterium]
MLFSETTTAGLTFFSLAPLVLLFPLLGLLINLIWGGRLSEKAIGGIASGAVGLTFVVALLQMISLFSHPEGVVIPLVDWINIGELNIGWGIQVDTLSVTMMLVVSGVGCLIHIYAIAYMHDDVRLNGDPSRYRRFFVFFNLFILAMMTLVSADNYLMLFVGWEGVGLCSYLLIGFWYDKGKNGIGNALAGNKAFITNRVGDFGFLLAAFTMFGLFRSFNFDRVFGQVEQISELLPLGIFFITLFMLIGVTGKSAQLPLYVWLPDAMAGPTPVSALIHAATMVTAGVYLIARSHPLYEVVPQAQSLVAWVGTLTALFAATIAIAQFDIKKVLAYSTISQLGFMVAAVGMGAYVAGMFHLVTHAFFKALLFLSSGSVIQGVERGLHEAEHHHKGKHSEGHHLDPQDMRNMGGLRQRMPTTFWVYLIGALALAGIVPLAGFWSKDEILLKASFKDARLYTLLSIAAFFTAFYMARQIILVFFGKARSEAAAYASESPKLMTVPLIILAILSVFGGALNLPGVHAFGHWLEHTIHHVPAVKAGIELPEFSLQVAAVSTVIALLAIALGWLVYARWGESLQKEHKPYVDPLELTAKPIFGVLYNKYWVDEVYWALFVNPYKALARWLAEQVDWRFWHDWFHDAILAGGFKHLTAFLAQPIDLGIIDGIANGLATLTQTSAAYLRRFQTGYVRNYALAVFVGVVAIMSYLIFALR